MSNISVSGVITRVFPRQEGVSQKTGTAWARQSYLIQHEAGQYPKSLVFDVNGPDRIKNFGLAQGQQVTVHLAVNAREYPAGSGKFYNSIEAWKVEHIPSANQPASRPAPQPEPQFAPLDNDSLPF